MTKRLLTLMDESKSEFLISQGGEFEMIQRLMARGIGLEEGGVRKLVLILPHRPDEYREFRRRVLLRPGFPGGQYPWHGQIKLHSFHAILGIRCAQHGRRARISCRLRSHDRSRRTKSRGQVARA